LLLFWKRRDEFFFVLEQGVQMLPKTIEAGPLAVAYAETGPANGWPVILLHGFPYDIHAYQDVAPLLEAQGARVLIPYLRGFGPTRFRDASTPRSGQQAALGADLRDFMDALGLRSAVLAGYDWGGRAACVVAALWPERARALVSYNSYNIQDIAAAGEPEPPEDEYPLWYQYYLHGERGRLGLERNRNEFCRLLWRLWSPNWAFDEATFQRSAAAFGNVDFVDVVVHSYRHRFGLVPGDPAYDAIERALSRQPLITVPTVTLDGASDGVRPRGTASHKAHFTVWHEHRVVAEAGHNLPQEFPADFADAVLAAHAEAAKR
jgi:pimeloyl-ACP methyl ester carboxylesterase